MAATASLIGSTVEVDGYRYDVRIVEGGDMDLLLAYSYAVACVGRVRRGVASPKDEVAAKTVPCLAGKVMELLREGAMAFLTGPIGQCFVVENQRIKFFMFFRN